ncbi:phosphoribosylamine--glycine ligase [Glaciecola sp. SC05]|uniref:phosphoribosylamine--glycine ligase n=1 Tax=Glaciecola sp. SC05 TaxID=1987355 RepID=UPI0035287034
MKVLVIGSGGREHALAHKASLSPQVTQVFVAPGNAGTQMEPLLTNIEISSDDNSGLLEFALNEKIDLTIVGPETPLVAGIVDLFEANNLMAFGPSQKAAQLEGSKAFTKDFLKKHHIPSGEYCTFEDTQNAISYIKQKGAPIVVKADGLAAGKGVIVAFDEQTAIDAVEDMLSGNKFGNAGSRVVIEEFLEGEEASFIVMVDGKNILPFATSQDHKRAFDGDKGPNTGGMGAYSPAPVVTSDVHERVMEEIIKPTVIGMAKDGAPFKGFLYAGLMINDDGHPKVIEYNCRFGDPETQPIMMRLKSDLVSLCVLACEGKLNEATIEFDPRAAVGVVLAAGGYPYGYGKGKVISGLDAVPESLGKVFHAGTSFDKGNVVTSGGRVLCATALGNSVSEAQKRAYEIASIISWDEMFYRKDIAYRAVAREQTS